MAWTTSADPRGNILSALRGHGTHRNDRSDASGWRAAKPLSDARNHDNRNVQAQLSGLFAIHAAAIVAAIASVETLWPVIAVSATSTALTLYAFARNPNSSSPDAPAATPPADPRDNGATPGAPEICHTTATPRSRVEGLTGEPANWSELMQRVSHELRTPLNAVIGFSDLMHNETFGPLGSPRYQEYARFIRDSGDALLKSTEDTLAMTSALTASKSRHAANPDSQLLTDAITNAWSRLSQRPENQHIPLQVSCDRNIEVLIDARPLRQILINLMTEAAARIREQGAPQGGAVAIKVSVDHDLVQIEISTPNAGVSRDANSLDVCVARALLELQGTSLLLIDNPMVGWRAITVLDRAAQTDFFHGDTRLTDSRHLARPADTIRSVA